MVNYGNDYRESVQMSVDEFNKVQKRVAVSTATLEGTNDTYLDLRRNARTNTESIYRLASDLRMLGIVSDEMFEQIRAPIAAMMLANYTLMSYSLVRAALNKRKLAYDMILATAETIAMAAIQNWVGIKAAVAGTVAVAGIFGLGFYLGRNYDINITDPVDRRMLRLSVQEARV